MCILFSHIVLMNSVLPTCTSCFTVTGAGISTVVVSAGSCLTGAAGATGFVSPSVGSSLTGVAPPLYKYAKYYTYEAKSFDMGVHFH